jgi:hypothetical protein
LAVFSESDFFSTATGDCTNYRVVSVIARQEGAKLRFGAPANTMAKGQPEGRRRQFHPQFSVSEMAMFTNQQHRSIADTNSRLSAAEK